MSFLNNHLNIGVIIQARMTSTRLPGKVLLPFPFLNGKPLLERVIKAYKSLSCISKVIVATSQLAQNIKIEELCLEHKISCFRGSENNVYSRFVEIQQKEKFDIIVRICADNPFVEISSFKKVLASHIENKNDYTQCNDLPLGLNCEMFRASLLTEINEHDLSEYEKEHVTIAIKNNSHYKQEFISVASAENQNLKKYRLTVDEPIDYLFTSFLYDVCLQKKQNILDTLKDLHHSFPSLLEVNQHVIQKS